jgi:ankyrin repeat protein
VTLARRHAAASYCQAEALKALLTALAATGRSVDVCDEDGDTPLHACESVECATLLLAAGASLTAINAEGQMPIDVAREDDRTEMMLMLAGQMLSRGIPVPTGAGGAAASSSSAVAAHHDADDDDDDDVDMETGVPPGYTPTEFPDE